MGSELYCRSIANVCFIHIIHYDFSMSKLSAKFRDASMLIRNVFDRQHWRKFATVLKSPQTFWIGLLLWMKHVFITTILRLKSVPKRGSIQISLRPKNSLFENRLDSCFSFLGHRCYHSDSLFGNESKSRSITCAYYTKFLIKWRTKIVEKAAENLPNFLFLNDNASADKSLISLQKFDIGLN